MHPRFSASGVLVLALVVGPETLGGQPLRVRSALGARVRVDAPPGHAWIEGTLIAADSGRVIVHARGRAGRDTIDVAAMLAVDVSRGRGRAHRAIGGGILGALGGGLVGVVVGRIAARGTSVDAEGFGTLFRGMAGAALGTVVGTVVGAATAKERWERIWTR